MFVHTHRWAMLLALMLFAPLALAHSGHAGDYGMLAGLLHPLLGWDHLLSAWMVGVLALAYPPERSVSLLPVFFAMMGVGLFQGGALVSGIVAEVMILAALLMFIPYHFFAAQLPQSWPLMIVAFSGLAHGQVHFMHAPDGVSVAAYAGGLILSSAFLIAMSMGVKYFSCAHWNRCSVLTEKQ